MTATTEEMERLRVRLADLPGFDPLGLLAYHNGALHILYDASAVPVDAARLSKPGFQQVYVSTIHARTRDALARWCAVQVQAKSTPLDVTRARLQSTAPTWERHPASWGWRLRFFLTEVSLTSNDAEWTWVSDLKPDDDRRLPDGSRWVDAAALAAVARHLGVGRG